MVTVLQFKFDANQQHLLQAVESVARLFEGMPPGEAAFQLGHQIVSNLPPFKDLNDGWLLENPIAVRERCSLRPRHCNGAAVGVNIGADCQGTGIADLMSASRNPTAARMGGGGVCLTPPSRVHACTRASLGSAARRLVGNRGRRPHASEQEWLVPPTFPKSPNPGV